MLNEEAWFINLLLIGRNFAYLFKALLQIDRRRYCKSRQADLVQFSHYNWFDVIKWLKVIEKNF